MRLRVASNPLESQRDRLSALCALWGWFSRWCGLFADSRRAPWPSRWHAPGAAPCVWESRAGRDCAGRRSDRGCRGWKATAGERLRVSHRGPESGSLGVRARGRAEGGADPSPPPQWLVKSQQITGERPRAVRWRTRLARRRAAGGPLAQGLKSREVGNSFRVLLFGLCPLGARLTWVEIDLSEQTRRTTGAR